MSREISRSFTVHNQLFSLWQQSLYSYVSGIISVVFDTRSSRHNLRHHWRAAMSSEAAVNCNQPTENWPDKEFLETALRKWLEDPKIKVTEFTSRIATKKGDNYTSNMYRVVISCEHRKEPITIVIKRIISSGPTGDIMMNSSAFVKEVHMLKTVLPEMHAVLKKVIPDVEPFGATCVYSTPGVLAMEDLQQEGFRMAQRLLGLDLPHCSLVLRTLARYHAASLRIMECKSVDVSILRGSFYGEPSGRSDMEAYCKGTLMALSEELKTFEGLEKYSAKLAKFANEQNLVAHLQHLEEDHEDGDFLVISHGDLWVNNILFRYSSSGELNGIRFVDLQLTTITSPCTDLQYFLTASPNETVRTTYMDQLLEEYHQTLCKTMTALKCSTRPPTLEKLKKDFDRCTPYGMFAAFTLLPVVLDEVGIDYDDMMRTGNFQSETFRGKSFRKALEWFLPIYESKGFL